MLGHMGPQMGQFGPPGGGYGPMGSMPGLSGGLVQGMGMHPRGGLPPGPGVNKPSELIMPGAEQLQSVLSPAVELPPRPLDHGKVTFQFFFY